MTRATCDRGFRGRLYRWTGRSFAHIRDTAENRKLAGWYPSRHLAYYHRTTFAAPQTPVRYCP